VTSSFNSQGVVEKRLSAGTINQLKNFLVSAKPNSTNYPS